MCWPVVAGLFASVVGLLAINRAADAFYADIYADCPRVEWSQALLAESQVIAEVPSESAGYYNDCDSSGMTELFIADSPEEGQCPAIVDRAVARGWTVIHQTGAVRDRDEPRRNDGSFGLTGQWHREHASG